MKSNKLNLPVILLILVLFIIFLSCKDEKNIVKQSEINFKKEGELSIFKNVADSLIINLDIEIADNDYEIQTGLMYRKKMEVKQGMLFIFDDIIPRYFYMKNTYIPLDIIFINENKTIVSFQKNTKPLDEKSLPSNVPAKYVLEVNAGKVDEWGISEGNYVTFTD